MSKSLLPPNSSKLEIDLENATKFTIDASVLKGFKFKDNQSILGYLIWEYNLNEVLNYLTNNEKIIENGLIFQRTKGTKFAVKIAAKWIGLEDIFIYEEEPSAGGGPSVHFYEFQIGVKDRQFDFDVELLKNVINLAKPVRSRLSRVYNDTYDVRYFKLDGSEFGSILSDNSGVKLHDLTLSFGRKSSFTTTHSNLANYFGATRNHSIASVTDMIFKLDFGILDEAEPDVNLIKIEYQKQRIYQTDRALCDSYFDIDKYVTFAKASIILSEDSVLEETNTCFNPLEVVESNATFMLGSNVLSEHIWSLKPKEILERFDNNIVSYSDISDKKYYCANPLLFRDFVEEIQAEITVVPLNSKTSNITTLYETNQYWSEHRHSSAPWLQGTVVNFI
jgi:P2-related tail formation protein